MSNVAAWPAWTVWFVSVSVTLTVGWGDDGGPESSQYASDQTAAAPMASVAVTAPPHACVSPHCVAFRAMLLPLVFTSGVFHW